jgi:uncharacterized damage-inducible protein DinB
MSGSVIFIMGAVRVLRPAAEDGRILSANLQLLLGVTRDETLAGIAGLTDRELDRKVLPEANTIGALLRHIACLNRLFYLQLFENRAFVDDETAAWAGALPNQPLFFHGGKTLDYYLGLLNLHFLPLMRACSSKDDAWLLQIHHDARGIERNRYYKLYHMMADEISHRGQIRMLRRLLSVAPRT